MHMYYAHMTNTSEEAAGVRLDSESLRVLAHPLRARLLSMLRTGGPATATDLACELGSNSGATSYHLRKLETVHLVTDTGQGKGKRRLWRAATASHEFNPSDFVGDTTAEADLSWLRHHYILSLAGGFGTWLDAEQSWPTAWRDAAGADDDFVTLTAVQARAMSMEIDEVVARYRSAGDSDPQARRMSIWRVLYPLDTQDPPRDGEQSMTP